MICFVEKDKKYNVREKLCHHNINLMREVTQHLGYQPPLLTMTKH